MSYCYIMRSSATIFLEDITHISRLRLVLIAFDTSRSRDRHLLLQEHHLDIIT